MAEAKKSDDNLMGALAYLLGIITGVIMYVMYKDKSKFVAFHGMQSIILGITVLVVWIAVVVVGMVLMFIPFLGWIIDIILWLGTALIILGTVIFMMYKAYSGEKYKLPFIGEIAEKYA